MDSSETELELLRTEWPRLAKDILPPALETLAIAHRLCGGDVELFLIMLTVAVRTVEHEEFQKLSYADLDAGKVAQLPSLKTNVRSIADSLGMAKETARRKVERLVAAGWIERDGAYLRMASGSAAQVSMLREAVVRLALRHHHGVERAMHAARRAKRRNVPPENEQRRLETSPQ